MKIHNLDGRPVKLISLKFECMIMLCVCVWVRALFLIRITVGVKLCVRSCDCMINYIKVTFELIITYNTFEKWIDEIALYLFIHDAVCSAVPELNWIEMRRVHARSTDWTRKHNSQSIRCARAHSIVSIFPPWFFPLWIFIFFPQPKCHVIFNYV